MKLRETKMWLMLPALSTAVSGGLAISHYAARAETPATSAAAKRKDITGLKRPLTFSRDIAPILYQNCATCHRPGEVAPFTLSAYKDAQKRARQIAMVTASRNMPPWKADSHGEFQDERRLTDAQIALIKAWVDQGAKEGSPTDLPPAPKFAEGWTLGAPDMLAQPPAAYKVGAEGATYTAVMWFPPASQKIAGYPLLTCIRATERSCIISSPMWIPQAQPGD